LIHFYKRSKMLMPKANRVAIFEHLFKEGVMVAESLWSIHLSQQC